MADWLPALGVGALASAATLAGGFAVLRLRPALNLMLAAAAGALIGVALFDLLPEALAMAADEEGRRRAAVAIGVGFALYYVLDQIPHLLGRGTSRSITGPASLTLHSLLDGFGIGVAFRASAALGWVVGAAVLAHDLVDGANTVALSLGANTSRRRARAWLWADAAAPLVGIGLAALTGVPARWLPSLLAAFCGVFLYIGAGELLPRSHRDPQNGAAAAICMAAMATMYVIARLSST